MPPFRGGRQNQNWNKNWQGHGQGKSWNDQASGNSSAGSGYWQWQPQDEWIEEGDDEWGDDDWGDEREDEEEEEDWDNGDHGWQDQGHRSQGNWQQRRGGKGRDFWSGLETFFYRSIVFSEYINFPCPHSCVAISDETEQYRPFKLFVFLQQWYAMTWLPLVLGLRLSVGWSQDPPDLLPERCGILTFDHNRMPPSEWQELIYKPFIHWSRHGGNVHRTTRDMALLLRNALMRGRAHIEGDSSCFCIFLVALLIRASADLAIVGDNFGSFYDVEHAAAHDMMAYFSHMIARTAAAPMVSSWPVHGAWHRALQSFRAFAVAKHEGSQCDCQEPDSFLTPALRLLQSMQPSNWAVADWTSFLDFEDARLWQLMEKSCTYETTCADVQVIAHLLCAEHFLLLGDAAKSLHKRGRAAAVAVFAPGCHAALHAIGSIEDVVYNAALGITEMTSAYLHRALVWRPMPARFMVQARVATHHFDAEGPSGRERLALFATLVQTEDHYKEQNFVLDAMRLKCSADRLGTSLPFHIIYGGGLMESELTLLMRFGFIIEDYSKEVGFIKSKCCELCPNQERRDGWATTFKLFAWKALAYDLVLHVDLDACFAGRSPEKALKDLQKLNITFLSDQSPSGATESSPCFFRKFI
eukprot:symbB.v1.2.020206.t1/scaffold1689.1/size105734/4